jgi:hypothetical protein
VLSRQLVGGLRVVEGGLLESFDHVAAGAVVGKLSRVGILGVTVAAGRALDSGELLVYMTLGALDGPVHTAERIARPVVVKYAHCPRAGVVASPAVVAQLLEMRIVVAIRASREPKSFPLFRSMTLGARDPSMRSYQRKSRTVVVEASLPKPDVEGVTSVAVLTKLILVNVFVTSDTLGIVQKVRLCLLPQG